MPLIPLKQFICDGCREPLDASDAYIEWVRDSTERRNESGFRIVHNIGRCRLHPDDGNLSDIPLDDFEADERLPFLLSKIDIGERMEADYRGPSVSDLREYVELIRRLQIPYYEEARLYLNEAQEAGLLDGENEFTAYSPSFCKKVVSKFSTY